MRWDQSAECRRAIERSNQAITELKAHLAQFREDDIRVNHIWQASNLKMLEQCVKYARHDMVNEYFVLFYRFMEEEHNRREEQLAIMKRYTIERWTSPHKQHQQELVQELKDVFKSKGIDL